MNNVISRRPIKRSAHKALKDAARAAKAERRCIVNGCGRLTMNTVPLHSYGVDVPVCTLHRDYLRELDMLVIHERIAGSREDAFPAASAYASVFPEARFDEDGVPNSDIPPEQAAMAVYSAAYLITARFRESGIVAVIEHTKGGPQLVWVDPWFIIPYDPHLEEVITGVRVTAAEGDPPLSCDEWVESLGDPSEVIELADFPGFLEAEAGEEDNEEKEEEE